MFSLNLWPSIIKTQWELWGPSEKCCDLFGAQSFQRVPPCLVMLSGLVWPQNVKFWLSPTKTESYFWAKSQFIPQINYQHMLQNSQNPTLDSYMACLGITWLSFVMIKHSFWTKSELLYLWRLYVQQKGKSFITLSLIRDSDTLVMSHLAIWRSGFELHSHFHASKESNLLQLLSNGLSVSVWMRQGP